MEAAEKRRADEVQRRVAQQAAKREQDLCTMRKASDLLKCIDCQNMPTEFNGIQ